MSMTLTSSACFRDNCVNHVDPVDKVTILLGGRVAEEIFVHDISSGAQMDITQASRLVPAIVCEWGITDELGTVACDESSEGSQYLGQASNSQKNYSEPTA